jgi:hypothetical protein
MIRPLNFILEHTLRDMITEAPAQETDNSAGSSTNTLYTPAEEKFLGKFDAYGTNHLGIIYSISDIGIREFIGRSGKDLNVTPEVLISLLRKKAVRIVPYTGFGRNDDYTIEMILSLDDVRGLGAEDKAKIEKGEAPGGGGAGAAPPMEPPMPGTEVAWVVKYGDILKESVKITKQLMTEGAKTSKKIKLPADETRILKKLPAQFVKHMEHIIKLMNVHAKTTSSKERIIADMLDILQINLNLTPKQIQQSYKFHKSQKRLQDYLETKK